MLDKITKWYKRDKKIIAFSLCCGFMLTLGAAVITSAYSDSIQGGIAEEVVRFHVLANSDSADDQALKLKVRDEVLAYMQPKLEDISSKAESRAVISENLSGIISCAKQTITKYGYDYPVTAVIAKDYFPTKVYGDISLPAGEYEALRIAIGSGAGKNWWCVMFPPLCFVDITLKEIPAEEKKELMQILTPDEYNLISNRDEIPVKIKFKIVEWWQEHREHKNEALYSDNTVNTGQQV